MSVRHGTAAPSHPQSLPSFAQAFSNSSLDRLSAHNNALPPIQSPSADPPPSIEALPPSSSDSDPRPPRRNARKRPHPDATPASRDEQSSDPTRQSPRLVRVKEEQDELIDEPSPPPTRPPRSHSNLPLDSSAAAAPPSSKKRRVTISGAAHPPDSTQPHPPDSTQPSSMSSMVIGLPTMRDDPAALEQVRSMLTIKQNQKALIEQRRGSLGGLSTAPLHPSVSVIHPTNAPKPQLGPTTRAGPISRSPNLGAPRMRSSIVANDPSSSARQPSPIGSVAPNQQPPVPPHTAPAAHLAHAPENPASSHPPHPPAPAQPTAIPNVLPPPPISFSFARRRGGAAGKKKPADIVISPRDVQSDVRLQPVIQSAPPVPQGGGGGGLAAMSGRFPMALPSLPPVLGAGQSMRRVAPGNVPPTPTRLSMRGSIAAAPATVSSLLGPSASAPGTGPSPPASVPIATTLVPPTPAALHHPGYAADKASFLAPFEVFYDALRDAKELKAYLAEQLHKASALAQSMQAQQERLDHAVEAAVERRMGAAAEEVAALRRRVEELEDTLHAARGESAGLARRRSLAPGDVPAPIPAQTQAGRGRTVSFRGGAQPPPTPQSAFLGAAPESYTFPPVDPAPRSEASGASPNDRDRDRDRDAEVRNGAAGARMNGGSPAPSPFDLGRRLSISSVRMDPPPPPPPSSSSQQPQSQSHPQSQSQSSHAPDPAGASGAKGNAKGGKGAAAATQRAVRFPERPAPLSRRPSSQHHQQQQQGEGEEQGQRAERKSPAAGRRPSSVVGASPKSRPESPMDESGV